MPSPGEQVNRVYMIATLQATCAIKPIKLNSTFITLYIHGCHISNNKDAELQKTCQHTIKTLPDQGIFFAIGK